MAKSKEVKRTPVPSIAHHLFTSATRIKRALQSGIDQNKLKPIKIMKLSGFAIIIVALFANAAHGQDSVQVASKLIVDNGNTHAEMATTDWGYSHGIFFGSKINYTGIDHLWGNGNADQDKKIAGSAQNETKLQQQVEALQRRLDQQQKELDNLKKQLQLLLDKSYD